MARYTSIPHLAALITLSNGIESRDIRYQVALHSTQWCDGNHCEPGDEEAARIAFAARLRKIADDIEGLRLIPPDYWAVRLESESTA